MTAETRIEVHEDAHALASAVAGALVARLMEAQADGHVPQVGLTGGTIADTVHRRLAEIGAGSEVDWSRIAFWWGDERFVAADSPERNAGQARAALLDHLPVDPGNVHEVPSTDDAADVGAAAAAYSSAVREHGTGEFDVLMLGVGPDGHVASLFPGSAQLDVDDVIAVAVTDSPKPPPERVTLTSAALNRSRSVWLLVSGSEKAEAVAKALDPATDRHDIPAAGVGGSVETVWFLDRAAASRL